MVGLGVHRPAAPRRRAGHPRRHRRQVAASAPTPSSACRSRWPRRRRTRPSLPLYRYVGGANAHVLPVPVHQRAERRRARRQQRRPPGVHARAGRRGELRRSAALGRRDVPRAQAARLHDRGLSHRARRRGRVRPESPVERGGPRAAARRDRGRGLHAGRRDRARARHRRRPSSTTTAATCSPARAPTTRRRSGPTASSPLCDRYPIVSIEDGMAEDDWDGWRALTRAPRRTRAARGRRPVRHQRRAAPGGHRPRRRQLDPHQGQPDRHAVGDARRDASSRARTATRR